MQMVAEGYRISIHVPHMESDKKSLFVLKSADDFNSRSLRVERHLLGIIVLMVTSFQFSLPVWGATYHRMHRVHRVSISILALRMGSDQLSSLFKSVNTEFQFTLSAWGAIV